MKFEIKSVKNGLILTATAEGWTDEEMVYQETYDNRENTDCFADFLRLIEEYYGPSTNRYSPKRIYITVKPGDKHSNFTDEEPTANETEVFSGPRGY